MIFKGRLVGIYIAPHNGEELQPVDHVEATAGRGLTGDRYAAPAGSPKKVPRPDQEVTLIEVEAVEALGREAGINLAPGKVRRNLVTQGVPLNHLVGQDFSIGEVLLRGLRLCEPCGHLESLTVKGVKDGLCHRGGLRAQVLKGGTLRVGDAVEPQA